MIFLKRLFQLLHALQESQVITELVSTLCHFTEPVEDDAVQFSRIRLSCDSEALIETEGFCHHKVQRLHLFLISIKEIQEACLGPGGALHASKLHGFDGEAEILKVHQKILHPQGCPFSYGGDLSGLIVGIS